MICIARPAFTVTSPPAPRAFPQSQRAENGNNLRQPHQPPINGVGYSFDLVMQTAAVRPGYTVSVDVGGLCCDVNHDGLGNDLDVHPFVQCLLNGACP